MKSHKHNEMHKDLINIVNIIKRCKEIIEKDNHAPKYLHDARCILSNEDKMQQCNSKIKEEEQLVQSRGVISLSRSSKRNLG